MSQSRKVIVIGAGPAGYVCAIRLAQLGQQVTVVEKEFLGGTCLNVGCIPSKAMIAAGTLVDRIAHASAMGIETTGVRVEIEKLVQWKAGIVARLTGGVGGLLSIGQEATQPVARFLMDAGVAKERLILEGESRNTYENAVFTRDLVKPAPGERWYLVTSAYHMPRAMGLFRKVGFDVVAYPVDYRTRGPEDLKRFFERIPQGLMRLDLGTNEWIGLIAYRALGRIDEVFPGP